MDAHESLVLMDTGLHHPMISWFRTYDAVPLQREQTITVLYHSLSRVAN
jgi:hypothetical protein